MPTPITSVPDTSERVEERAEDVAVWALTPHERAVYEAGFHMGFTIRELEIQQAHDEANRYYRAAFDHDHHDCRIHTPTHRRPRT